MNAEMSFPKFFKSSLSKNWILSYTDLKFNKELCKSKGIIHYRGYFKKEKVIMKAINLNKLTENRIKFY